MFKSSKSTNQHQSTMTDEPLSIHGELCLFSLTLHVKNTRVISPVSHHTTRVAPLDETNRVQAVAPQSLRRSSSQPTWYRTTQQQSLRRSSSPIEQHNSRRSDTSRRESHWLSSQQHRHMPWTPREPMDKPQHCVSTTPRGL